MYVKLGSITVYISFPFAVFLAVAANIAGGRNLLLSFLFSFIHEAVHLIFLRFSGIKKAEVRLFPAGIKAISFFPIISSLLSTVRMFLPSIPNARRILLPVK